VVVPALVQDEEAVERYPELAGLVLIRDAGWQFMHHHGASGEVTCIDGYYQWPGGQTDAIAIKNRTDVLAVRMTDDEPPGIVWQCADTLAAVVGELLSLPAPDDRLAPRLRLGTAPHRTSRLGVPPPATRLWTP
jgi:hypothetical protein